MSPLDQNQKRIKAIQSQIKAGKVSEAEGLRLIAKIQKAGPKIVARYKDPHGKDKYEPAKSWKEAEAIEVKRLREIQVGDFIPQDLMNTPLVKVLEFYYENKMHRKGIPRSGAKSAKAHVDHARRMLGPKLTLSQIHKDPDLLAWHFRLLEEKDAKAGYKFYKQVDFATEGTTKNYFITLAAATRFFLRKKRINLLSPFTYLDRPWRKGVRVQVITWAMHCKLIKTAVTGRWGTKKRPFPAWLPAYLEAGWETGWRAGEIQDWHWERVTLDPNEGDFPFILTLEEKQGDKEPVYTEKPITPRLAATLKALPVSQKERGCLWPMSRSARDVWTRRVFNAAGGEGFTFHDYRRAFKRRIQESALPIPEKLAMDYTGHKTRETSDRYTINKRKELEFVLRSLGSKRGNIGEEGLNHED